MIQNAISYGKSLEVTNGLIKPYKSFYDTVDAGEFVELVNGIPRIKTPTCISSTANIITCTQMSADTVCLFYFEAGDIGTVSAAVCKVENDVVSVQRTMVITSNYEGWKELKSARISESQLIVFYYSQETRTYEPGHFVVPAYRLYGKVVDTSTGQVGSSTDFGIVSDGFGYDPAIEIVALSSSDIFIQYPVFNHWGGSASTVFRKVTVSNFNLTMSPYYRQDYLPDLMLSSSAIAKISANKVLIIYYDGDESKLKCGVITISGQILSCDASYTLYNDSSYQLNKVSVPCMITDNKFLISFIVGSDIYAEVISLDGSEIAVGNTLLIAGSQFSALLPAPVNDTSVFAIYGTNTTNSVYLEVNGLDLSAIVSPTPLLNGTAYSLSSIDGTFWISYNGDNGMYLVPLVSEIVVRHLTDTTKIAGVTNTQCTNSSAGEVWILNKT